MPKISVVIAVYNVEKYLEKCLDSIIGQTLSDIEIIIINDGSTDNSAKIIERYAEKDKRIIFITQKNKGLSVARNAGINIAKGEFIGFIDSDDWVDLNFFEKLYNAAIETDADIAMSGMIRKREYHQKYRVQYIKQEVFEKTQEKIDICNIPKMCYATNKIYNRKSFKKSGFLFKEGVYFEDVRFTIKVICYLGKLVTVPDVNYFYRVNRKSIVKSKPSDKKLKDYYEAMVELLDFVDKYGIKINEKARHIVKDKKYFLNILWLKTKMYYYTKTYYLFGFIPLVSITRYPQIKGVK